MHTDLIQRVLRNIVREQLFVAGDRVGVGVSGGADSVALLRLLMEMAPRLGVQLTVLHFDHQLRGAESEADKKFVSSLAGKYGLPCVVGSDDVKTFAQAEGLNLEDAARRMRYGFFSSVVDSGQVHRIAVAHTADDQAETVLARVARGTGPAGLAAIYPVNGHVVRPLLEIRRTQLQGYLHSIEQSWREDSSNQDTSRLRARLRHRILPILERELQPGIVRHLGRLAQLAREDEAFWSVFVGERLTALTRRANGRIGIRAGNLLSPLSPMQGHGMDGAADAGFAVTKRLIRGIVQELRGDRREVTAQHIEQVLHLASTFSSGHRTELPGVVVERSFEWLWFSLAASAKTAQEPGLDFFGAEALSAQEFSFSLALGNPGESTSVVVPEINRRFRLKVIDWSNSERDTGYDQGILDRDLLSSPLILRNWRPGDAFRPQGRRSVYKLKHLLRDGKVALRDRAGWPVLTSREQLVWARGLPPAAEFSPRKATRLGVVIAEEEI